MAKIRYTVIYLNSDYDTCIYFGCQCALDVRLFISNAHLFGADRVFKVLRVEMSVQNEVFDVTDNFMN